MGPQSRLRARSLLPLALACLCAFQLLKTQHTQAAAVAEPTLDQKRVTQDKGPADGEQLTLERQPRQLLEADDDDDDYGQHEDERAPLRQLEKPLAPGEQKVMFLGRRAAKARASQLDAETKQHVRLVHETLPDGRKLTYEIVDELIEDDDDDDDDNQEEAQQQAETRPKVGERPAAPAVAEQAGAEVSVKPSPSEPLQVVERKPPAQDLAKEQQQQEKLPTVSNNAVASVQLAAGGEQPAAKKQSAEPSEQQQAHEEKTPHHGTGPAADFRVQPQLAKADVREQEPAKSEQRNEQQTTDHSDAPSSTTTTTTTSTTTTAAPAPQTPVAAATDGKDTQVDDHPDEPLDDEPEPEVKAPPQAANVAIKGVGNKKRKLVDKLEKNIIKAAPNAGLSIEDSGNETEEVVRDHKLNEVVAPSNSPAKKDDVPHGQANGTDDSRKSAEKGKRKKRRSKKQSGGENRKDENKNSEPVGETANKESGGDDENKQPVVPKRSDEHEPENETEPAEVEAPQQVESGEGEPQPGSDQGDDDEQANDESVPADNEKSKEGIKTQSDRKELDKVKKSSENANDEQEVAKGQAAGKKPGHEEKKNKRTKKGKLRSEKPKQSIEANLSAVVTQAGKKASAEKEPKVEQEQDDDGGHDDKTQQPSDAAPPAKQVVAPGSQVSLQGADGGQVHTGATAPATQQVPVQQHTVRAANSPGPFELQYVQPGTQQQTIVQPSPTTTLVEEHNQQLQQQTIVDPNSQTVIVEEHTTVHEDGADVADGDDLDEEETIEIEEGGGRRRRRRGRRGWGRRRRGRRGRY